MWTASQIQKHIKASKLLDRVQGDVFLYISKHPDCTEYEVQQFIKQRYGHYGLQPDKAREPAIVAFGASSAVPHYWPSPTGSKRLKPNTLVLVDIWAKLKEKDAPFADITWIGFYGHKIPPQVQKVWDTISLGRDRAIKLIERKLKLGTAPSGLEIDNIARETTEDAGLGKYILHRTGHSIGTSSPHGPYRHVNSSNPYPLVKNLGYTIEPGIYIPNKFGIRSEIDFYIDSQNRLRVTTPVQNKIVKI